MNILHISAYAHRGGCEKNCFIFVSHSPTLVHEIVVLGKEGPMSEDWRTLSVPIRHLDILQYPVNRFRSLLKKEIKGQYDVVIYWSNIRLSAILNSLRHRTEQVKIHLGNPYSYNVWQIVKEIFIGFWFKSSAMVELMACSEYVAKSYRNKPYYKRFPISVSLNPVEIPDHNPKTGSKFENPTKVGMVARLDPIKNHALLLEAFKIVSDQRPGLELHLLGEGVLRGNLIEMTHRLQIQDKVFFHGQVKDVYTHLQTWDIFVYATTAKEGLANVVSEAMANGLPCLLPNLPMIRELAPNDIHEIWYEHSDAHHLASQLYQLVNNPTRLKELSNTLYEHVKKNLSSERYVQDHVTYLT